MAKVGRPPSDEYTRAKHEQSTYGIPEYAFRAWNAQRYNAKRRGIPFKFSLFQWDQWWHAALASLGPEAKRGRRLGLYMMARIGDAGAYEHGNVYAATAAQNAADIPADVRANSQIKATATMLAKGRARGVHLKVRGDGHPRSKPVITAAGRFGSIRLAADAYGISERTGRYRISRGFWHLEA